MSYVHPWHSARVAILMPATAPSVYDFFSLLFVPARYITLLCVSISLYIRVPNLCRNICYTYPSVFRFDSRQAVKSHYVSALLYYMRVICGTVILHARLSSSTACCTHVAELLPSKVDAKCGARNPTTTRGLIFQRQRESGD